MRLLISLILFCSFNLGFTQSFEKTFVRTDKDLYQPGDTLWFKGYVFNRQNLISDESLNFHVFLHDDDGLKRADASWPIIKGMSPGYLVLPLEEGRFFLTAITPNALNMESELSFRKEIHIRSGGIDIIKLSAATNQESYNPGDDVSFSIHAQLSEKEAAAKERFRYTFLDGDTEVKKGGFRTNETGDYALGPFTVPYTEAPLRLLITKPVTDFTPAVNLSVPIAVKSRKLDLHFFPEGGQLISGANNRVAFKALSPSGQPIPIKALILDNNNNVVDSIESHYAGMGSFSLRTDSKAYKVKVTEPAGVDSLYQLPMAKSSGLSVNLSIVENDTLIKVIATKDLDDKNYRLSLSQHDREVHRLDFKAKSIQFFKLPLSSLDIGIARLSVIDEQGQIVSERLIFMKNEMQLNIEIDLNNDEYLPRDEVQATLRVTDDTGNPVVGNFTFSAVDDTYSPSLNPDQPTMMAQLLLNSELRGSIPTPNFYFGSDPKAPEALDLVMLTHGWRKYELISQKNHNTLTGILMHRKRKKMSLSNREISIFNTTSFAEEVVVTDAQGRFEIPSHHFKYKGDSFIVAARAEGKKEKPNMLIDSDTQEALGNYKSDIGTLVDTSYYQDYQMFEAKNKIVQDRFGSTALLNAINVVAENTGSDCEGRSPIHKYSWKKKERGELNLDNLDPISIFKQVSYKISRFGKVTFWAADGRSNSLWPGTLLSMERQKFKFELTEGTLKVSADMSYVVSINCERLTKGPGANTQDALSTIDLSNVESISILDPIDLGRTPKTIPVGAVEIHTIDDKVIYKPSLKKFFTYTTNTTQEASFYQMKYDTEEARKLPIPDLRTTIHWEHTVITNEKGEATVRFYNSDRDNRIRITVEGLGQKQRFGFAQKDYRVLMPASNPGN